MSEKYFSEKNFYHKIEGEGEPPEELKEKAITYIDSDGKKKWILHPDFIDPQNKTEKEKAQRLAEERDLWPYH